MGLMTAPGRWAERRRRFNFEPPAPGQALYLEPTPAVRVVVRARRWPTAARVLLHESGHQPIYYFPPEDVARRAARAAATAHTHCPKKGDASYCTIRAGDTSSRAGAWYYPGSDRRARRTLGG